MVVHDGVRPIARRRRARLVSIEREGGTLGGLKLLVALFGEVEQCVEFGAVERAVFGGALDLDEVCLLYTSDAADE